MRFIPIIISILFVALAVDSKAQEFESFYQNYIATPVQMNVARSGAQEHEIILDYHKSFTDFDLSPQVAMIMYDGAVSDNIGIGAMIGSHRAGYQNTFRAQLNYSYLLQFATSSLRIGLGTAYQNRSLNSQALTNPNINPDDPLVNELADGLDFLDLSFGVHYEKDKWKAGISLPNAYRARLDKEISISGENRDPLTFWVAYVEYLFPFEEKKFNLHPSIYVKNGEDYLRNGENNSLAIDLNCLMSLSDEKLYGGVSYRVAGDNSATTLLLGAKVSKLNIYYSYQIGFSEFQQYNNGSHEISCQVNLVK